MALKKFNKFFESMGYEDIDIIKQVLAKKNFNYELKDESIIINGLEYNFDKYKKTKDLLDEIEKDNKRDF